MIDDSHILEIEHVSKKFPRNLKSAMRYGTRDLVRAAVYGREPEPVLRDNEFWALCDVSLNMKPGESIAILGANGSGKSTLLKLVNGLYVPNEGEIRVRGTVGALIDVAAGFHPNLTGRQNIYVKGALLGLTRRELDHRVEQIADFAGIGEFIDSPVKMYSSGMYVRLGFAIAVNVDPDILIVDEALAVGDFSFTQKCLEKINELRSRMALLLVSHNMNLVSIFCEKAVVLDHGKMKFEGSAADAASYYMEHIVGKGDVKSASRNTQHDARDLLFPPCHVNKAKVTGVHHTWVDENHVVLHDVDTGQFMALEFSFTLRYEPHDLVIAVSIYNKQGQQITRLASDLDEGTVSIGADGTVTGRLIIDHNILNPGAYVSMFMLADKHECIYREFNDDLDVKWVPRRFGFVTIKHQWEFKCNE